MRSLNKKWPWCFYLMVSLLQILMSMPRVVWPLPPIKCGKAGFRRFFCCGIGLPAVLLMTGCQTVQNAQLLLPPSWIGMHPVAADVWIEAGASPVQKEQVITAHAVAHQRLSNVLGDVHSRPVHVFCVTDSCFQRFGGGSPRAKALGEVRTLFSPSAITPAFVAHEWWHIELHHRVGFWVVRGLPRWFDEGVAVWISEDPQFGETMYQRVLAEGIVPPTLEELTTMNDFIAAVGRYGDHLRSRKPDDALKVVYPTAAHEIRRWMGLVGEEGLRSMVVGLSNGERFEVLYRNLELNAIASKKP